MDTLSYALDAFEDLNEEWQRITPPPSTPWSNHSLIDLSDESEARFKSNNFNDYNPKEDNFTDIAEYSDTNGDVSDFWLDEESSSGICILTPASDDHYHETVRTSLIAWNR
jgi:hypothetical protein